MSDLKPSTRKHKWSAIIASVLLCISIFVAIGWGVYTWYRLDTGIYTDDAQVEEYINPVNTRITGYLKQIRFTDHQRIRKGDTLVTIDEREFRIAVEQAHAAWLAARLSKDVTASSVSTVNSNLRITEANIRSLDARIWNAQQNLGRFEHLLKEDAATQQQYDQVKTDYTSLIEQKEALVRQRMTTGLSTTEASRRIPVNEADIQRARAAVDLAELNLSYTIIVAPYDGAATDGVISRKDRLRSRQGKRCFHLCEATANGWRPTIKRPRSPACISGRRCCSRQTVSPGYNSKDR